MNRSALLPLVFIAAIAACGGIHPQVGSTDVRHAYAAAELIAPDAYLLMANPAEDMATGITIGWHTQVEGTFVEIALMPDERTSPVAMVVHTATDPARVNTAFARARRHSADCAAVRHHDTATDSIYNELRCVARISGLQPGREYVYRAGRDTFSPVNRFHTAAPGETFSFLYMSDVHVHNPIPLRLSTGDSLLAVARTIADDIRFTIFAGDMLAYGSAYDAWQSLTASDLVRTQTAAFTPGNHDFYDNRAQSRGPGYFNTFVYNPTNGAPGVENTSYFFRFANLLVLSISSEDSWAAEAQLESQQKWFRDVVANDSSMFSLAFTHRPFYNGSTGNAGHAQTNRTNWSPIFDEVGLDLMLAGHDHVYVRTARTYGGELSTDPVLGTVYFGSTAVGGRWREVDPANPYTNIEAIMGGAGLSLATIFTVGPDAIRARTFNLEGRIVDETVVGRRR